MSRCFPFPPPGYEKKARTDEVDLLNKEKQKEKKRKKEKRDKEKRESKEKKENEGRDGKHKEKKDKKEKNREKKKDKDKEKGKDRDKSKIGSADNKGIPGQAEGPNAGKFHQKEIKQNDKKGILFEEKPTKQYAGNGEKARQNNHLAEDNKDSKFLLELDRRIKDDNGGAENQLVHFTNSDHRKDEGNAGFVAKGSGTWPDGMEKLENKVFNARKIDAKGIRAEARPIANATVQNHARPIANATVQNHARPIANATVQNHARPIANAKVQNHARPIANATVQNHARPIANATVQNHDGNFHPGVDGMPRILGNHFDRTLEAKVEGKESVREKKDEGKEEVKEKKDDRKEKVKEKKDDKRGDKRKDKEKEKKGHGKDKDRDKEKKKKKKKKKKKEEEKAVEHSTAKNIELNKLKESTKAGHTGLNSSSQVPKNSHENAVSGENPKKRKGIESNGVLRANDNWPSKLPRPSPSNERVENGRILEPCQISIPNASDKPGVAATKISIPNALDKPGVAATKISIPNASDKPGVAATKISVPDASDKPGVAATNVKVENKECKINGIIEAPPNTVSSIKTRTAVVAADPVTEASAKPQPPHPDTKYLSQVYSVPKIEEWSGFDDQEWLFDSGVSQERKSITESLVVGETPHVWAEGLHIEPADVFALPYVIPY